MATASYPGSRSSGRSRAVYSPANQIPDVSFRSTQSDGDSIDTQSNGTHCHTDLNTQLPEIDKQARKKLVIASILCLLFTIGEAVGGVLAGSLAIATDSAHMLTDFASFMISLLAIYLASRPATTKLSFGWHRAEIIGALVSVQMIWIITGILVYMAIQRVINQDYDIDATVMMITAACAVAVNIVLGLTLHGVGGGHGHSHSLGGGHGHSHDKKPLIENGDREAGHNYGATQDDHNHAVSLAKTWRSKQGVGDNSLLQAYDSPFLFMDESFLFIDEVVNHHHVKKENMNVRAAFIHVIGDFIQSIGVLIASIIIYFKPEYKLADPICTFIFSVLVIFSTLNILKDAFRVLMEGTPQHIDFTEIKDALLSIDGVRYAHNLRIWSLTTTKITMSVHLAIDDIIQSQEILQEASKLMHKRFAIQDSTIQIELYAREMDDCDHCQDPVK